jgi:serine/threonine protein phosphatase PrpC
MVFENERSMDFRYWAGTDVGRKRTHNEDNYLIDKNLNLFVVADGMGGHASGEVASAMAVHAERDVLYDARDVIDHYNDDDPSCHIEICTLLEYAVHIACDRIYEKALQEPEKRGMGTTLVLLLIIGERGFIAYVGDSRIYLLRGGAVYQLTEDHSLINELVRKGKMRADEFEGSPYANFKNAMTRAVGVYENVEVDTLDFDVIPGDCFLLCSDGLSEYVDDTDITNTIALPDTDDIPGRLIELANTRGGKDNITAVVIQVPADESSERAAEVNLTLDTLKKIPLFNRLSYQQLVRIMNVTRQRPLEKGHVVCREGEAGEELYLILRGKIGLTKDGVTITELGPGSHFGEMSLVDASARSATATAVEAGKLLTISRQDFYEILRKEAPLAVKLLWSLVRVLAERLRVTTADLSEARHAALPDMTDDLFEG